VIRQEDKELLFMGKITGSITHDLNNVLATIEMNSALIQDIFSLSPDSLFTKQERIPRAFRTIDNQVNRGVELTNRLNSFAHIVDEVETNVDLNEMTRQIAFLSERFARLKQVDLKVVTHNQPLLLIQQPFKIQMALFFCLELILENLQSPCVLVIRTNDSDQLEMTVDFSPEDPSQVNLLDMEALAQSPKKAALQKLVKSVNGRIESGKSSPWMTVIFSESLSK
jgi:signal transduction histidine kinase